MKYYQNIVETIGHTPLVKLNKITKDIPGLFLAKVEYFNPGNSIKDRIGLKMVLDAEKDGKLKPGGTIIECTSGNTGMGLALASVVRGYKCIFTTTDNLSNRAAHYETTGPEIWEQTEGKVTHYITTIGTGGTVMGVAMYLKEKNPNIQVWGIDVYGSLLKKYHDTGQLDMNEVYPYVTEGIGEDFVPANYDMKYIDHIEQVTDKDGAIMARKLAREEGLFCGYSAGTVMQGLLQLKDKFKKDDVVVIILHDHGSRYVAKIYNDSWMKERGFLTDEVLTAKTIIERKQIRDIICASPTESVAAVFHKMKEMHITQLPVMDGDKNLGSITEHQILRLLIDKPAHREDEVGKVMGKPFPLIDLNLTAPEISKLISKDNTAVLVRANSGALHIITEFDLIEAMA